MYIILMLAALAVPVMGQPVDLYSGDDYPLAGAAQNGKARAQQFNAIDSTPDNGLTGSETFTTAAISVALGTVTDTATLRLSLYQWQGTYAATITSATLAGPTTYILNSTTPYWIEVTSSTPLTTNATYLLRWDQSNINQNPNGYQTYRSNTDDGGPNNEAYHDGTLNSTRDYQIRLGGGSIDPLPPPASAVNRENWSLYR